MLRIMAIPLLFWLALGAAAQTYPSRAVTLVVPYPLSGPTDIRGTARMTKTYRLMAAHAPPAITDSLARIVQQALRYDSKHPVVLERQPGGITTRGAQYVAQSAADGHTLLLASNATMVLAPHFVPDVGYDPIRDFELVAPLVNMPFVLMLSGGLQVKSLEQLIAYIKVRPGEINYASSGDGSTGHLAGELLSRAAGLNMVHVAYNGGLAALNGLATGQTSLMYAALPLALPYINNQYLRPLAIASVQRSVIAPDLPTLEESGVRGAEASAWYGVFAPNGVAPGNLRWLSDRISEAMHEPATRQDLIRLGLEPLRARPSEFASRVYAEGERWGPLLKAVRLSGRNAS